MQHAGIDPTLIQDIAVGTVLPVAPLYEARCAALAAGIPQEVPVHTINRFCSSGLMAVASIANAIRAGQIQVGLAVGVESMSSNPDDGAPKLSDEIMAHPAAHDSTMRMGWTSENVAADFGVTREQMDAFAATSVFFARAPVNVLTRSSGHFSAQNAPRRLDTLTRRLFPSKHLSRTLPLASASAPSCLVTTAYVPARQRKALARFALHFPSGSPRARRAAMQARSGLCRALCGSSPSAR